METISVGEWVLIIGLGVSMLGGAFTVGQLFQRVKVLEKVVFNDLGRYHDSKHPDYSDDDV